MKKAGFLCILSLTLFLYGCYRERTQQEIFAEQCEKRGFTIGSSDHQECVESAIRAYYEELDQRQRDALIAQQKADSDQCKEYGFKKSAPDFANCIMKLDQARKQEIAQEKLAHEQMNQQEKWHRYQADMQSIHDINESIQSNTANQPLHCHATTYGNQTDTTCN